MVVQSFDAHMHIQTDNAHQLQTQHRAVCHGLHAACIGNSNRGMLLSNLRALYANTGHSKSIKSLHANLHEAGSNMATGNGDNTKVEAYPIRKVSTVAGIFLITTGTASAY